MATREIVPTIGASQGPPLFHRQDAPPLRDLVYDAIRDAILDGTLASGERVKERNVAAQMGVSTTPVKEALRRLEQDGLIVSRPRRGAVVSEAALTSIQEIIEIRASLEGLTVRLAAEKMNDAEREELSQQLDEMRRLTGESTDQSALEEANARFHHLFREAARNSFLHRFLDYLEPFDRSVRHHALLVAAEARRGLDEHARVCAAVVAGHGTEAEQLMQNHIRRTIKFVVSSTETRRRRPPS